MATIRPNRVKQKLAAGQTVLSVGGIDSPQSGRPDGAHRASMRSGSRASTGRSTSATSPI